MFTLPDKMTAFNENISRVA